MKTYAMIIINLEAFSIDTNEDVVGDGVDTFNNKLLLDYTFGLSKCGNYTIPYDITTQSNKTLITTPVNVEVM